jgi:hypothetical protein
VPHVADGGVCITIDYSPAPDGELDQKAWAGGDSHAS